MWRLLASEKKMKLIFSQGWTILWTILRVPFTFPRRHTVDIRNVPMCSTPNLWEKIKNFNDDDESGLLYNILRQMVYSNGVFYLECTDWPGMEGRYPPTSWLGGLQTMSPTSRLLCRRWGGQSSHLHNKTTWLKHKIIVNFKNICTQSGCWAPHLSGASGASGKHV